jgi:hypothetical protein
MKEGRKPPQPMPFDALAMPIPSAPSAARLFARSIAPTATAIMAAPRAMRALTADLPLIDEMTRLKGCVWGIALSSARRTSQSRQPEFQDDFADEESRYICNRRATARFHRRIPPDAARR